MILSNARLVLSDEVKLGSVVVDDGKIVEIGSSVSADSGDVVDLGGDYLIPGLIDVHSDNLEKHISPRPNVIWPGLLGAIAHDADVIGVGITTVLDAIALSGGKNGDRAAICRHMIDGLQEGRDKNVLRADHLLHIRCEVPDPAILERFEAFAAYDVLHMISLMDHTPGQRVFRDIPAWREYRRIGQGLGEEALDLRLKQELDAHQQHAPRNRPAIAALARDRSLVIATHDDATREDIIEGAQLGSTLAEFPTTIEAARSAREYGLRVIMGAPNVVRGGSHIGNLSAQQCAAEGLLDILSSDYMPVSLLHAAFLLTRDPVGMPLAKAIATVTENPAKALNLTDRGTIAIGKNADLVRVKEVHGTPIVKSVWRLGTVVH